MLADRYLNLLKASLLNEHYVELEAQLLFSVLCAAENMVINLDDFWATREDEALLGQLRESKRGGDTIIVETGHAEAKRVADPRLRNFTEFAYTLVGRKRLDHLQRCVEQILCDGVGGDLLEAGVWRGGCCILMRATLQAHGCSDRKVWLCDSFQGLPNSEAEADRPYPMSADRLPFLAVSEEQVRENFRRFDLLDENVRFLPGWFEESLRDPPIDQLALLRLDADLFTSTTEVLTALYPKVSSGGWVIIDDYKVLPPCKQAVDMYRESQAVEAPLQHIDDHAVCWQVP